jgi:tRNA modification GTPase
VTLLDTAGLRTTEDEVESIGVDLAMKRAKAADLRVFLVEPGQPPALPPDEEDLVLIGKADLCGYPENSISGVTGHGVRFLIDQISNTLASRAASAGVATRLRHKHALVSGSASLVRATDLLASGSEHTDLSAEELRSAVRCLDSLVGRVDIEAVLDEIFLSFCLGK